MTIVPERTGSLRAVSEAEDGGEVVQEDGVAEEEAREASAEEDTKKEATPMKLSLGTDSRDRAHLQDSGQGPHCFLTEEDMIQARMSGLTRGLLQPQVFLVEEIPAEPPLAPET